jgi:hypothetical protein
VDLLSFRTSGLPRLAVATVIATLLLPAVFAHTAAWQEKTSDHFQVFYLEDRVFASEISQTAERLYSSINSELGFDRAVKKYHLSFWLWNDRCKIYLYPTRREYILATGAPAWSAGFVRYRERVIHSYEGSGTFLESTLPHELAHILFREFVGYDNPQVPRWLDEGVARYAEATDREASREEARQRLGVSGYFPFTVFQEAQPRALGPDSVRIYYLQAESVVTFLIESYGSGRFVDFCSNLRDGYPIDRALSFATGSRIASLKDLEAAWLRFIQG